MLAVEPLQRPREAGLVERQRVELHQLAEILARIAHADMASDPRLALQPVAPELVHRLAGEGPELIVEQVEVHPVGAVVDRARPVDPQVRQQRAEGRAEARMGRHHDFLHLQRSRHVHGVQRAGAAEGDQRIVAVVDAALDGHQPDGVRHVLGRGLQDRPRRLHRRKPERGTEPRHRLVRTRRVEGHLAAEEVVGVEAAQHHVGVGHRGLGAALAVAGGAGVGAGAARPDAEQAADIDMGDGTAAGADGGVVDEERTHRHAPFHLVFRGGAEGARR